MRIVTGCLRGRHIPFNPRRYGDIRVTPARLKEAVFDRLGPALDGVSFLDVCAGSGQMALEAYSRGARVTAVEPDRRRRELLRQLLRQWGVHHLEVIGRRGQAAVTDLVGRGRTYDIVYLDPPYHARQRGRPLLEVLLAALGRSRIVAGQLLVQHPRQMPLPRQVEGLQLHRTRRHGTNLLSEFHPTRPESDP